MTTPRPHLTDADLDQALDAYLLEAPLTAAERVAEKAMLAVVTTRQRGRGWLGAFGPSPARTALATAAAIGAIVIGFGVWRAVEVSVTPTPTASTSVAPTSSDEATPAPLNLETFSHPELGWEVDLPEGWTESVFAESSWTYTGSGARDGVLRITVGDADGNIYICTATSPCRAVVATTLTQLQRAVFGGGSPFESRNVSSIDGEEAIETKIADLDFLGGRSPDTYLVAMHAGRPLFIHYHAVAESENYPWRDIRTSFRFTDEPVIWRSQVYEDDGFAIRVPRDWLAALTPAGQRYFTGRSDPAEHLEVIRGDDNGTLIGCRGNGSCLAATPSGLADFVEAIFPGIPDALMTRTAVSMDGEKAWVVKVDFFKPPQGDSTYLFAIHEGRPWFIRYDFDPAVSRVGFREIWQGFQFIDAVTFERPADGYALTLTDRWSVSEAGLVTFLGPTGRSFRIVAGTTDGRITVCGIPFATQTEECPERTYTDATAMIELLPGPGNLMGVTTTDIGEVDLGGDPARLYQLFSFDGIAWAVLAVHDGRPFVLVTSAGFSNDTAGEFRHLIASFAWLP